MSIAFTLPLLLTGLVGLTAGELHVVSLPPSIELESPSHLSIYDVSHVITYLMGFPTHTTTNWKVVKKVDIFDRPSANLLINLQIPREVVVNTGKLNVQSSWGTEGDSMVGVGELNDAIQSLTWKDQPVLLDFMIDSVQTQSDVFAGVATTMGDMKTRLTHPDSIMATLDHPTCLDPTREGDQLFFAEIQLLMDILHKLESKASLCTDAAPDSYNIILTSVSRLAQEYGVESCQVRSALQIFEEYIPKFIDGFKKLYDNNLLTELNTFHDSHSFDVVVLSRATRAISGADVNNTIGNTVEPTGENYAATLNITIWFSVFFALAVFVATYLICVMDPGSDS
uniref:Renin receptor n=1 Tax=Ciona savignyi TaxID=51511 RepID=H2YLF9_CIOSA